MILLGETNDDAREMVFHLPSTADPMTPVTGHVFVGGEVQVRVPGGVYVNVDVTRIREKGNGDYAYPLTDAQVTARGRVYLFANVTGAQPWSSYDEIWSAAQLASAIAAVVPSTQRIVSLLQMRTSILKRMGAETSTDLTPTVVNECVNEGLAEFWDILLAKDDDRLVTVANLPVTSGVADVSVPSGFYQLRKVEIVDSTMQSGYRRLRPVALDAKHLYSAATLYGKKYRYWLNAYYITLVPAPVAAETLRVYYLPVAPVLVNDTDTIDDWNGYSELIIQLGVKRCYVRRDLDTTQIDNEIERLTRRIKAASDARDDEPFYLDPRGPSDDWDGGQFS